MKSVFSRVAYLGIGLGAGMLLAGHSVGAAQHIVPAHRVASCPPARSAPLPNATTDTATGMRVSAAHLHFEMGDSYSPPKLGYIYAVLHVSLYNGGRAAQDYNALDFHLHGTSDQVNYDADAFDLASTQTLSSGKLAARASVAGDLAFEVPTAQRSYTLLWDAEFDNAPLTVRILR